MVSSQIVVRPFQQAQPIPRPVRLRLISRQARRVLQLPVIADHVKPATVVQQHRANSLDRAELEDAHQIPTKRREYTQSIQPDASATARVRLKRVELTPDHVPQGVNHVIVARLLIRLALLCPALQL